jgi:hypothetical protein
MLGHEERNAGASEKNASHQPRASGAPLSEIQVIRSKEESGGVYLQTPVANALMVGRCVFIDERALPDRLQVSV